jgi:next to BRCA1 gene 1 protein
MVYPNPLLKFTVFDENVHKVPSALATDPFLPRITGVPLGARPRPPNHSNQRPLESINDGASSVNSQIGNMTSANSTQTSTPRVSWYHIPPPPVIFSFSPHHAAMDVDHNTGSPAVTNTTIVPDRQDPPKVSPQHQVPQSEASHASSCCAVSQAKLEIQTLMGTFKDDIDRIITSAFGSPSSTSQSPPSLFPNTTTAQPVPATAFPWNSCSQCSQRIYGLMYSCNKCVGFRRGLVCHRLHRFP